MKKIICTTTIIALSLICSVCFAEQSIVGVRFIHSASIARVHTKPVYKRTCREGEVLELVYEKAPEWIDDTGDKLRMRDDDENGIPDLFEQTRTEYSVLYDVEFTLPDYVLVVNSCSDIDRDGIPDCVERWDGGCETDPAHPYLDPYSRDSDGDGLADGFAMHGRKADVCPFSAPKDGESDEFTPEDPNYSCDPMLEVYAHPQVPAILACFLDRDRDGIRDCFEDKDSDGNVDAPIAGIEGIILSESDPLDTDTDDDGVSDWDEFFGWPISTNAALSDTDGDAILDGDETPECAVDPEC